MRTAGRNVAILTLCVFGFVWAEPAPNGRSALEHATRMAAGKDERISGDLTPAHQIALQEGVEPDGTPAWPVRDDEVDAVRARSQ
jgi:hypothetical protein